MNSPDILTSPDGLITRAWLPLANGFFAGATVVRKNADASNVVWWEVWYGERWDLATVADTDDRSVHVTLLRDSLTALLNDSRNWLPNAPTGLTPSDAEIDGTGFSNGNEFPDIEINFVGTEWPEEILPNRTLLSC